MASYGGEGARFLVAEHPGLFEGVRHAIGEFGGFNIDVAGHSFSPIMVAEKQVMHVRATMRGPAGHGSLPIRGGATGRLGELLRRLDRKRLPVHVTPVVRLMIETMADELPRRVGLTLRGLLRPTLTDWILDRIGERGKLFDPILHNTVGVTGVRGGEGRNVIPGEVTAELDCRLLPGFSPEHALAEIRALAGSLDLDLEVVRDDSHSAQPDFSLYDTLAAILRELDPATSPVPLLLPAVTDGRIFARLGIQTYGFLPMQLPKDLAFLDLIHAADERLPVNAMDYGTEAISRLIERFS